LEEIIVSKLKVISRKFTACTRTGEDNKIEVDEKIRQRKNVSGKMEGKGSNKYLDILDLKLSNCNLIQNKDCQHRTSVL